MHHVAARTAVWVCLAARKPALFAQSSLRAYKLCSPGPKGFELKMCHTLRTML